MLTIDLVLGERDGDKLVTYPHRGPHICMANRILASLRPTRDDR